MADLNNLYNIGDGMYTCTLPPSVGIVELMIFEISIFYTSTVSVELCRYMRVGYQKVHSACFLRRYFHTEEHKRNYVIRYIIEMKWKACQSFVNQIEGVSI